MKKCILLAIVLALLSFHVVSEAEINLDFSGATDEELFQAIDAIKAEQRSRLTTHIAFDQTELQLAKGKSQKITATIEDMTDGVKAGKLTWTSSDKTVASVTNGTIKAVGAGTAIISCTTSLTDGTELSEECFVEVYIPVASIKMAKKRYTLKVDEAFTPEFTITPKDATSTELEMISSDSDIAYVDNDGDIVALTAGEATITATATDGSDKSVSFTIVVEGEKQESKATAEKKNSKSKPISKKLREGKYVVGKDIPAGTYEITCLETEGERLGSAYGSLGSAYDALDDNSDGNWSSLFSSLGNMMSTYSDMTVEILGDYGDVLRSYSMKTGDTIEIKLEEKTALQISEGTCQLETAN